MRLQDWPMQDLLLHVGEMTVQERRTVRAVLAYIDTTRVSDQLERYEVWKHLKSGKLYEVLQSDAHMEHDQSRCVVYRSMEAHDKRVWVRPATEFFLKFVKQ